MKPLFDILKLDSFHHKDKLPFECENCSDIFYHIKKDVRKALNNHPTIKMMYCSRLCKFSAQKTSQNIICTNCSESFEKQPNQIKKSKNHFCSRSCAATYNNKHKKYGIKRSKLEIWLENQLTNLYPDLDILFNNKETIKSELDIYIPSMKLAFELNGIFHYKPIYGEDKLQQIQENDISKSNVCNENKIDLFSIDTSNQKHFNEHSSYQFLDYIKSKIDMKSV